METARSIQCPLRRKRLHVESLEPRLVLNASFGEAMPLEPDPPWHLVNADIIGTADVDDDGDRDVIARLRDELLWLEFDQEEGDFTNRHPIPTLMTGLGRLAIVDFDGDGDDDILSRDVVYSSPPPITTVAWFENRSGTDAFAAPVELLSFVGGTSPNPKLADIDGDGDVDLQVVWSVNGVRETHLLLNHSGVLDPSPIPIPLFAQDSREHIDLDSDGDLDFFGCVFECPEPTELALWRENLDGLGAVGGLQTIEDQRDGFRLVLPHSGRHQFVDLDADDDLDIWGVARPIHDDESSFSGPAIEGWWESTGDGSFQFHEQVLFETPEVGLPRSSSM